MSANSSSNWRVVLKDIRLASGELRLKPVQPVFSALHQAGQITLGKPHFSRSLPHAARDVLLLLLC